MRTGRARVLIARRSARTCTVAIVFAALSALGGAAASAKVLHVGTYNGKRGHYNSIQVAVNAAEPGDWVLIGPGDYHEPGNTVPSGAMGDERAGASVLVTKPGIHIRGMDRNGVVIDGTKRGAPQCSSNPADQTLGTLDSEGKPNGRNGLIVFK